MAVYLCAAGLRGDQLEMQNGDHYSGKVISMTADKVVLQSDVLGKITVPRAKVQALHIGTATVATSAAVSTAATSALTKTSATAPQGGNADVASALRSLGANTNFVEQIRKQFLADAGPEANAKYDDMIGGLMSGKLDISALRAQAKSAADQIRDLEKQGGDSTGMLDTYLTILNSFLKETSVSTSVPVTRTNYGATIIR